MLMRIPALFVLMVGGACARASHRNATINELKSAIAVSQLVMAQQAEFFKKLINVTQDTIKCNEKNKNENAFTCPYPFTRVVAECFHMSKTGLNWEGAREHCQGMGGDLATPNNLYALKAHLIEIRAPRAVWIGGTFYGPERGWEWVNGVTVNAEEWSRNQPNNGRKRANCLSLRRDRHPALDDVICAKRLRFVCQYTFY